MIREQSSKGGGRISTKPTSFRAPIRPYWKFSIDTEARGNVQTRGIRTKSKGHFRFDSATSIARRKTSLSVGLANCPSISRLKSSDGVAQTHAAEELGDAISRYFSHRVGIIPRDLNELSGLVGAHLALVLLFSSCASWPRICRRILNRCLGQAPGRTKLSDTRLGRKLAPSRNLFPRLVACRSLARFVSPPFQGSRQPEFSYTEAPFVRRCFLSKYQLTKDVTIRPRISGATLMARTIPHISISGATR